MKRPLAAAAAAFAVGILAANSSALPLWVFFILSSAAFAFFVATRWTRRFQPVAVGVLFFSAGALIYALRVDGATGDGLYRDVLLHPQHLYTFTGEVREAPLIPAGAEYARVVLDVDAVEREGQRITTSGGLAVRWSDPAYPVLPGERIRVRGFPETRLGPANFGIASLEDYFHRHGIYTQVRTHGDQLVRLGANHWSPRYWAARLRAWEADAFREAMPARVLPFVFAVWLGERSNLDVDQYQHFINTGTAHILAVSGVHCGLVYATVLFLLGVFIRRPKLVAILAVIAVFAFALAAGARVSSLRAACMLALYLAARLVDREPDAPTALGIAGLLFLLFNPLWLFDAGFLLSFGSVASILLFVPPLLKRFSSAPHALGSGAATALGVQIVPLPLAAHFFHVVPLLSPALNIVIVPLLTIVLWLCLLTIIWAAILPPAAPLFGYALLPVVAVIENSIAFISNSGVGRILAPSPNWSAIGLYALGVGMLFHTLRRETRRRLFAVSTGFVFALAVVFWGSTRAEAGVDFLDVGHGDAALVCTPGGTTILIDGGDASEYTDLGARVVAPYLLAHGITELDYVVATHPDRDHIGGIFHILDTLKVGAVVLGPRDHGRELESLLAERCREKDIPILRLVAGETVPAEGAVIRVLHPPAGAMATDDANNDSLVLHVSWEGLSVLFTGDVEAEAERSLLDTPCDAAVMKVPHHGSATSSTAEFLEHVAPKAAVVSTGPKSQRRPVGVGILERYTAQGIEVLRTDQHGGVRLRVRDGTMVLTTARTAD